MIPVDSCEEPSSDFVTLNRNSAFITFVSVNKGQRIATVNAANVFQEHNHGISALKALNGGNYLASWGTKRWKSLNIL